MEDTAFQGYGRLIFPVDIDIDRSLKLKDVSSILPWYSEVSVSKTVEIVNYMKDQADSGAQIFYDIYNEEENFFFIGDYVAVMVMIAFTSYYIGKFLRKAGK